MKKVVLIISVFLLSLILNSAAFCQKNTPLEEAVKQYQLENYEEAIEALEKVRAQEPKSSLAAFFLGMAYKQTMNYDKAAANLEDALRLKPAVKEALVECVNVLFQLNKLAEAKKWIKVAREQNIAPANIAFLEGMILARERSYAAAITAFEKAKSLDQNLAQTADYQIALCYMNDRKYKNAQERFKATASYDPKSDLAVYARQYLEAVENTIFYTRPVRVTIGLSGGYDSNVISNPRQERFSGPDNPGGNILSPSLRIEYVPRLDGPWLFNAMYASSANFNERYVHTRDSIVNTFSMIPGYNFGRFSVSMLGSYTNYSLRVDDGQPSGIDYNAGYKHYQDYYTFGPIVKIMLTEKQILEAFAGYDKKNYYNQIITADPGSMRDAEGPRGYLSWAWFFWNNGFVNLRYDVGREATNGSYWDNTSNRFSASLVLPVLSDNLAQKIGFMYLQLTGGFTAQDYSYPQPYADENGIWQSPGKRREDRIYNGSIGLNWDISKNWTCTLQYARINSDSNIPAYENTRNLYTMGMEFKF